MPAAGARGRKGATPSLAPCRPAAHCVLTAHLHVVENFLKGNAAKGVTGILADLTAVDIARPEVRPLPVAAAAVAEEAAFPLALAVSAALAGAVVGFFASRVYGRE